MQLQIQLTQLLALLVFQQLLIQVVSFHSPFLQMEHQAYQLQQSQLLIKFQVLQPYLELSQLLSTVQLQNLPQQLIRQFLELAAV